VGCLGSCGCRRKRAVAASGESGATEAQSSDSFRPAAAQSSGPSSAGERCRQAASSEDGATEAGNGGAFERQRRRAAAASRRPPAYGGVGVVPLKPSSVMPPRPRRRRPNRLRVRVPLLSPPAKRLRTCGRRERETDIGPIFGSRLAADAKCIIHLPTPLDVVFFSWTMQNGFRCRNGYPVGDSLTSTIVQKKLKKGSSIKKYRI